VKGVITPERAEYYKAKQIEWLQSFGLGFDPNDESTWTSEHLPVAFKGGMYFSYASSHEKFVWESRTEPGVLDVFSKLWDTDELLCSFDGMNVSMPNRKDLEWSPWPHCDQNPSRKGMQCVQGLLNYQPNGPKDGGLIVMKGSSKLFDQFFQETRVEAEHPDKPPPELEFKDLFLFNEKDVQWFKDHGCELIKLNLDPGDLVLWDSRTMHYAAFPEGDLIRHIQYICMVSVTHDWMWEKSLTVSLQTPKKFAKEEDLEHKARLFNQWQGTTWVSASSMMNESMLTQDSHWPHCNIHETGPPMRNGKLCPHNRTEPREKPELTDRVLQLAAVKAY